MAKRIIVRVELIPSAKQALDELTDKKNMTQTALFSRLVEWLAQQPSNVIASILGELRSEVGLDTAKLILQTVAPRRKAWITS